MLPLTESYNKMGNKYWELTFLHVCRQFPLYDRCNNRYTMIEKSYLQQTTAEASSLFSKGGSEDGGI